MKTQNRQPPDPDHPPKSTCDACKEASCAAKRRKTGESDQDFEDRRRLEERLCPILRSGGGQRIALDMGVPFLGSIPIDPQIAVCCDEGRPFIRCAADSLATAKLREIIRPIDALGRRPDAAGEKPLDRPTASGPAVHT